MTHVSGLVVRPNIARWYGTSCTTRLAAIPRQRREQHRDLHPGRNTVDVIELTAAVTVVLEAGTGKGTTAAAVAAALIRADDASRNALRPHNEDRQSSMPMPRGRVLLLSFSRPSRPSSRPFKSGQ